MPYGDRHQIEDGWDRAVDAAADELARSVARGLSRKPWALFFCALTWIATLPLQAFTYLCGN